MLLSFPYMHPELFPSGLAETVRFFDPGMTDEPVDQAFQPEGLPMDGKTAKALIADCIAFGEQFKDPGEMAYFGAMTSKEFYEGSSMSIQAQLTRQFSDVQGAKEDQKKKEADSRAQFILLLAWFFEEKMIELEQIETGIKDSWKNMDKTLGVDADDRIDERVLELSNRESHTSGMSDEQAVPLPWQRIIEALPPFLPQDTVLLCADKEIIAAWDDLEIEFTAAESGAGLPDGAQTATFPAWKFAGRRKAPANMAPALTEVTVAIVR